MAYEVDIDFSTNRVGAKTLAVRKGKSVVARFTVRDGLYGPCRDEADAFAREHNAKLAQGAPEAAAEAREWAVNVRAVVRLTQVSNAHDYGDAFDGWDIYDQESGDEPDTFVIRCDRIVRVTAATQDDAVEQAQADAPGIPIPDGYEGEVSLWVDEGIDIDPEHADIVSPSP